MSELSNLSSGLLGALVGSGIGALVTFRVTSAATAAERDRSRMEYARNAAAELLEVLADVQGSIQHLPITRHPTFDTSGSGDAARAALDGLHRAQTSVLPRIGNVEITRRWGHLRALAGELAIAHPIPDGVGGDPVDWTTNKVGRARGDVQEYLTYVRESIEALIDEKQLPPYEEPAYLRRPDNTVWTPAGRAGSR